jgi:hypothetical protein
MEPYIKSSSPLRGAKKPRLQHAPGLPGIQKRQRDEVASTRRALKKAARGEGRKEIEGAE